MVWVISPYTKQIGLALLVVNGYVNMEVYDLNNEKFITLITISSHLFVIAKIKLFCDKSILSFSKLDLFFKLLCKF